ncbi:MAG: hypothetical protein R3A44_30185 [Caldilineaceae bacterium]
MKIWRIINPRDYQFAQASLRNVWSSADEHVLCPNCNSSGQKRIPPLIIEWQEGSDVIGDFTWTELSQHAIATSRVFEQLQKKFGNFIAGPVEMVEKHQKSKLQSKQPGVLLPYRGPQLFEIWISDFVSIDMIRSNVVLKQQCDTCGRITYQIEGVELHKHQWNKDLKRLEDVHESRQQGKGLYIEEHLLLRKDIFRIHEFPDWLLCTNAVKDFIDSERYSNVGFLEYGETFIK